MRTRDFTIFILLCCVGCSTRPAPRTAGMEAFGVEITAAELRQRLYRYERAFTARIQFAADEIVRNESERLIREMSIRWKVNAVPAIQAAVFQPDPLAGLADAWGLTRQMENFFTTGEGKELFGDSQSIAVEASRALRSEVLALARSVVGEDKLSKARPKLEAWLDENPILDVSFGRRSTAIDAAAITASDWDHSGMESVGQIEDLVRDLSDRMTIYATQIPELTRSHGELMAIEMNRHVLAAVWEDIASVDRSVISVDRNIASIDAFATSIPEMLETQRIALMATLQQKLEIALTDVDRQRLATLASISSERVALMQDVDELRSVFSKDLDAFAAETGAEAEEIVQRQAIAFVDRSKSLVDMIFWRSLMLVTFALLGLALVLRFSRPRAQT